MSASSAAFNSFMSEYGIPFATGAGATVITGSATIGKVVFDVTNFLISSEHSISIPIPGTGASFDIPLNPGEAY